MCIRDRKGTTNGTITGLDGDFSLSNVKEGDINAINPQDIENISVLKDAAAVSYTHLDVYKRQLWWAIK